MSKSFKTRKRGTPRQIGQKFPVIEKKKLPAKISIRPPKPKVEYVKSGDYEGRKYDVYSIDGEEVEVYHPGYTFEGYDREWNVIWGGALDFQGNKRELLKRYPELRGHV